MSKISLAKMIGACLAVLLMVAIWQSVQLAQLRRDVAYHRSQVAQIAQEREEISAMRVKFAQWS